MLLKLHYNIQHAFDNTVCNLVLLKCSKLKICFYRNFAFDQGLENFRKITII